MRNLTGKFLYFSLIFCLFAAWLCVANSATAATITDVGGDNPVFSDGADGLPQPDLSGWFGNFDPSNEWTNANNIATLQAWLAAAEGFGPQSGAGVVTTASSQVDNTPEPATLGLLGIALAVLTVYVPLRKSDRSLSN